MVYHIPVSKDLNQFCCRTFAETGNSQLKTLLLQNYEKKRLVQRELLEKYKKNSIGHETNNPSHFRDNRSNVSHAFFPGDQNQSFLT